MKKVLGFQKKLIKKELNKKSSQNKAAISKRLKAGRYIQKQGNCLNATKISRSCIGLWLNTCRSITLTLNAKFLCETWPNSQIIGKAKYSWRQNHLCMYFALRKACIMDFLNRVNSLMANATDNNSAHWSDRLPKNERKLWLDTS